MTVIVIVIIWAEYEMYVSTAGSPEFTRINGHKMSSCFCFAGHFSVGVLYMYRLLYSWFLHFFVLFHLDSHVGGIVL